MSWETIGPIFEAINSVLWHESVLWMVLAVGLLFTIWSKFGQFRSLTHGVAVIRGKYDHGDEPGAVSHFQALSAALSATVGLGNIAGVSVAVALGGPGAVFWMWVVGLVGMAVKLTEVTQSMLYRSVDDPDNPHGGPMWVAYKGLTRTSAGLKPLGYTIGAIFCVTTIISAVTGGNMFQAWNVGDVTQTYFGIPPIATGTVLALAVGLVILGGIKRIGAIAGKLVPAMCLIYLVAALYVLALNASAIPSLFGLIFAHAFSPTEASGAFLGGTFGYALLWGMKRALFSSEAGQGSSPMAHSAARTNEPVREGVVAGLEPFIDTIIVCTITALVILSSGAWNRGAEAEVAEGVEVVALDKTNADGEPLWTLDDGPAPVRSASAKTIAGDWVGGESVFVRVDVGIVSENTNSTVRPLRGTIIKDDGAARIEWAPMAAANPPAVIERGVYVDYAGASLTGHAFDRVVPGLGKYLVVFASWLFALSTIISWSYYGEQGMVFLFGERSVAAYRIVYTLLILVATAGWMKTADQLDTVTTLGTGVMLLANLPIMLLFGAEAMSSYHKYIKRLDNGEFDPK